jgi:hypothetical protein
MSRSPIYDELALRRQRRVAASRYRQVRVTFTHEASGRASYSIYAKGLQQAWDEHTCLVRGSLPGVPHLLTTEDVLRTLIAILEDLSLSSSDD